MAITKLSNSGIATGGVLKYDSMLAGNPAFSPNVFESITTLTASSGTVASFDFTSIPSTYKHLQLRGIVRATDGNDMPWVRINNSSTSSDYMWHNLVGNGQSLSAGNGVGQGDTYFRFRPMANTNSPANSYAGFVMDILDYANTSKIKAIKIRGGHTHNLLHGTQSNPAFIGISSGAYFQTSAINRITFITSANYAQYSSIALYGIREV